ncbi:hypothetical protein [Streptomyces sp. NPDC046988]|uniref:hypothetical protein n=1 Tax=Streptomyces sp. NPDC046988 TaxID=3154922 RepID=UPI0033C8BDB1
MPRKDGRDAFEDRLSAALRDAGDGFETDRGALVTAGRVRGRRARLRRRTAVVGGVAGVALAGVGGALVLPADEPAGPARSSVSSNGAPTAATTAYSGDDLLRELKAQLPKGVTSQEEARGTHDRSGPTAALVFDDSAGAAAISLGVERLRPGSDQVRDLGKCPDKNLTDYDDCVTDRLADGSLLRLYRGYEYPDRRAETKLWTADLVTAEGHHVTLSEWNSPAQKGAPVSRDEPPLTTAQLRGIVTAGVWREVADAIPESRKPSATPSAEQPRAASGKAVTDTLARLLPEKLDVVARGGQESEYAYVVVDDGRGASLVQINVQHGMDKVAGELYGDGETLPDGTRVATRQSPGEKGGSGVVMWTADTLRAGPEGFRVVVSAFNTGDQNEDATRNAPALTMEQLRKIALSEEWDALR